MQLLEKTAVIAVASLLALAPAPARAQGTVTPAAGARGPGSGAGTAACAPNAATGFSSRQMQMERVSDTHWKLTGLVEVECDRIKFFADAIEMFTDTNRLVATGNVVFSSPAARIAAEKADFDTATLTGVFTTASGIMTLGPKADRTLFAGQDPDVYFYGQTIERLSDLEYRLTNGAFTTCVQPTPRWELVSGRAVITVDDHAVLRNTVLKVKGVPLMYIPYAYYPLKNGQRATGFLLPTYGTSIVRGQAISNAFFLEMGRSQDATFFHDWFTRAGQGVGGEYRYVAAAGAEGNLRTYLFNQQASSFTSSTGTTSTLPSTRSFELTANVNQTLGPHMRVRSQVDYFSSLITQQLYQQNVFAASRRQRVVGGTWSGIWRQYSLTGGFQRSELLDLSGGSLTYGGAPRASAAISPTRLFGLPIYGSAQTEFARSVYVSRSADGRVDDLGLLRFDATPTVRVPLSRWPFLTVNSSATWRNTFYSESLDVNGRRSTPPIGRHYLDLRAEVTGPTLSRIWDFGDGADGGIHRLKHVIEPYGSIQRVTGTDNRDRIVQLYDVRDYVVQGTTAMTYGLTNRLLVRPRPRVDPVTGAVPTTPTSTREYLSLSIQQTYYTQPEATQFDFTYVSASRLPTPGNFSPVAVSLRAQPWTTVTATSRVEYDVSSGTPISTGVQAGAGPVRGVEVNGDVSRIFRQRLATGGKVFDTVVRLGGRVTARGMRASYAITRDVSRGYNVQQSIGWSYNAQCCGLAVDYQAFNYPELAALFPVPADRRIQLSFTLAGLGTFQNMFGAFGGTR
ncbi:MAG: LPS-assembly protein LptD [Vicinamibacterales bacterium]